MAGRVPKSLSDECPLCRTKTMAAARLPDGKEVIACTSCGVCSEPCASPEYAKESWRRIRSALKKPTADPELDRYSLSYGDFRTCGARYVDFDRPMTCDAEALDYARDFLAEKGLPVVRVTKSVHPWWDAREVGYVCDPSGIEVRHQASIVPGETGTFHRPKWAGRSMNRKKEHPERDVVLLKLASDMHHASFEIDPYEYRDQYGEYPSDQGYEDAFNLLLTLEGVDAAIEFVEEGADADTLPGYDDLLARLRARRDALAGPVGSHSRKSGRAKSRSKGTFARWRRA